MWTHRTNPRLVGQIILHVIKWWRGVMWTPVIVSKSINFMVSAQMIQNSPQYHQQFLSMQVVPLMDSNSPMSQLRSVLSQMCQRKQESQIRHDHWSPDYSTLLSSIGPTLKWSPATLMQAAFKRRPAAAASLRLTRFNHGLKIRQSRLLIRTIKIFT